MASVRRAEQAIWRMVGSFSVKASERTWHVASIYACPASPIYSKRKDSALSTPVRTFSSGVLYSFIRKGMTAKAPHVSATTAVATHAPNRGVRSCNLRLDSSTPMISCGPIAEAMSPIAEAACFRLILDPDCSPSSRSRLTRIHSWGLTLLAIFCVKLLSLERIKAIRSRNAIDASWTLGCLFLRIGEALVRVSLRLKSDKFCYSFDFVLLYMQPKRLYSAIRTAAKTSGHSSPNSSYSKESKLFMWVPSACLHNTIASSCTISAAYCLIFGEWCLSFHCTTPSTWIAYLSNLDWLSTFPAHFTIALDCCSSFRFC